MTEQQVRENNIVVTLEEAGHTLTSTIIIFFHFYVVSFVRSRRVLYFFFFFSSRRRHTRFSRDWRFRRVLFRSRLVERLGRARERARAGEPLLAEPDVG